MKNSVKSMTRFNGDTTYYLPSILFNNRQNISSLYYFLLFIPILYIVNSENKSVFALSFAFYFPALVVVFFLLTPRTLILRGNEIQHYSLWKEKWTNIKDFSLKNDVLTLETLDGKTRIVKNIDSNIAKEIIDFINQKINVTT